MSLPTNFNIPAIVDTTSIIFGATLSAMSTQALFRPQAFSEMFGLPLLSQDNENEDKDSKRPPPADTATKLWIPLLGARNIATGTTIVVLGYQRDFRAVGVVLGALAAVGVADATTTWKHGTRKEAWNHIVGSAVVGALAGYLSYVH